MAFDTIFQNATSIKWFYRSLLNTTTSQSGVTLVQDPNQNTSLPVNSGQPDGAGAKRIEFTVGAPQGLKYSTNRALIEDIYNRENATKTFEICFGNLTNLAYITDYWAGNVTQSNISLRDFVASSGPYMDNVTNKPVTNITIDSNAYPNLADGDGSSKESCRGFK